MKPTDKQLKQLADEQQTTAEQPLAVMPARGWHAGQPTIRRTFATVRDGGKERRVIVVLYPSGRIGLRLEGLHNEESVSAAWCYEQAVRARVINDAMTNRKGKKK